MTGYPSTLTSFSNPVPTDRLNNPSHSSVETAQNTALSEIQNYVGVITGANASAVGTLLYDIKAPGSNGGGHVQTAPKGGTGQTTYNTGDVLYANSPSSLGKLTIGSQGEVLAVGGSSNVQWASVLTNKVAVNVTSAISAGTGAVVLYSASVIGSTLGTNNAIRFTGMIQKFNSGDTLSVNVNYGNNTIFSIPDFPGSSVVGAKAVIQGMIVSRGAPSSQIGYMTLIGDGPTDTVNNVNPFNLRGVATGKQLFHVTVTGTSSINSSANQNLVFLSSFASANANNSVVSGPFVLEKIQ